MAGYVFLSYSHDDAPYAATLTRHLRGQGLDIWVDEQIRSGDRWDRSIKHKIDGCSAFIVIMSPAAEDSRWVPEELERAISKGKPILPLLLVGEVIFGLARIQYLDVRGEALPPDQFVEWLREVCVADDSAPDPPVRPVETAGPAPIGVPSLPDPAPPSDAVRPPAGPAMPDEPADSPPVEPVGHGHGPMVSMPRVISPPSIRGVGGSAGPMTTAPEPPADPRPGPAAPWRIEPPPPPPGTPPVVSMPRRIKPPAGPPDPSPSDPAPEADPAPPPRA